MADVQVFEFTDANFATEVLGSELPVVVDFWAEWCAPCRAIGPLVAKLAAEYEGKVRVGKVNVDHNPAISRQYRITSIPTLMLFRGGEMVSQIIGGNVQKIQGLFTGAVAS